MSRSPEEGEVARHTGRMFLVAVLEQAGVVDLKAFIEGTPAAAGG